MLHITKIKPLFTSIVTTGDRCDKDVTVGGIIVANKGDLKSWQTVLAVGSAVRDISVGDKVMVNMENYAVKRYDKNSIQNDLGNNKTLTYAFNWVTLDGDGGGPRECLLLNDRDVQYVFEGEERDEAVVIPSKKILL